jgi:hypothetical protein
LKLKVMHALKLIRSKRTGQVLAAATTFSRDSSFANCARATTTSTGCGAWAAIHVDDISAWASHSATYIGADGTTSATSCAHRGTPKSTEEDGGGITLRFYIQELLADARHIRDIQNRCYPLQMVELNCHGAPERSQFRSFTQREFLICNESEAGSSGGGGGGQITVKLGPNILECLGSSRKIDGHREKHAALNRQRVFTAVPAAKRVARIKVQKSVTDQYLSR